MQPVNVPDAGDNIVGLRPIILAAALITNLTFAVLWPNEVCSILGTLLYLATVWTMFSARPVAVVLLAPFVILHLSALVSLNLIEGGGYMKEMAYTGRPTFAAASYACMTLIFLASAVATFDRRQHAREHGGRPRLIRPAPPPPPVLVRWAPAVMGVLVCTWLFLAGLKSGFPLLTGTDRFAFRRLHADIVTLNLLNLKILISALLGTGASAARSSMGRLIHHGLIVSYLLISFLYGDKFFIVLNAVTFYLMPFLIRDPDNTFRAVRRIAPLGLAAVAVFFGVTLFIYTDYGTADLSEGLSKLVDRMGGQGQLWYMAVIDDPSWLKFDAQTVMLNLRSLFAVPASDFVFDHRLAAFYFVEKYSPQDLYNSAVHQEGWVTPTMVYEAYGLAIFGFVGVVVQMILTGILAGVLVEYFARAIATKNMFNVLLPAWIMAGLGYVMSQATLHMLLGVSTLKAYAAIVVVQIIAAIFIANITRSAPPPPARAVKV